VRVVALAPSPSREKETYDQGFLHAFREFESIELQNRARLNSLAGVPCLDEILMEEVLRVEPSFIEAMDGLGWQTQTLSPGRAERHLALVMSSRIASILREAPFFRQILDRPRGYSGDAEMMRYIYRARFEGKTPFGRFWHLRAIRTASACAVRNRKEFLIERILARPGTSILSLAAGPAEEIRAALDRSASDYAILALDHDLETLRELRDIRDPRFHAALANAFRMIKGEGRIAIPRLLGSLCGKPSQDFRGWRRLLAPFKYRFDRLPGQGFDLVYSAGLYDYIWPSPENGEEKAQALTRFLFDLVAPGGELVIGNFNPSIPRWNRFCMEFLCDWHLVYRTDHELHELAARIDLRQVEGLEIVREPEGINSFFVLKKRRESSAPA